MGETMETLWISCMASILYYPLLNLSNTLKGMLANRYTVKTIAEITVLN